MTDRLELSSEGIFQEYQGPGGHGATGQIRKASWMSRSIIIQGYRLNRGSVIDFLNSKCPQDQPPLRKGSIFGWGGASSQEIQNAFEQFLRNQLPSKHKPFQLEETTPLEPLITSSPDAHKPIKTFVPEVQKPIKILQLEGETGTALLQFLDKVEDKSTYTHITIPVKAKKDLSDDFLEKLSAFSSLEKIELQGFPKITDAGLQYLHRLPHLQHLVISNCIQISSKGLESIRTLPHLLTLKLNLPQVPATHFFPLAAENTLQQLTLCDGILRPSDIEHIAKMTNLTKLELEGINTEVFRVDLMPLQALEKLTSLHLKDCRLNGFRLNVAPRFTYLTTLDSNAGSQLNVLPNFTHLTTLDLSACRFSGENPCLNDDDLSILPRLTQLESINLSGSHLISDNGLKHLKDLHNLKSLDLSECTDITDEGVKLISNMNHLTHLHLQKCPNITDIGLTSLSSMKELKFLNIRNCHNVTAQAVDELIVQLPNLKELNILFCNKITQAEIQAIRKKYPQLTIS